MRVLKLSVVKVMWTFFLARCALGSPLELAKVAVLPGDSPRWAEQGQEELLLQAPLQSIVQILDSVCLELVCLCACVGMVCGM